MTDVYRAVLIADVGEIPTVVKARRISPTATTVTFDRSSYVISTRDIVYRTREWGKNVNIYLIHATKGQMGIGAGPLYDFEYVHGIVAQRLGTQFMRGLELQADLGSWVLPLLFLGLGLAVGIIVGPFTGITVEGV